MLNDQDSANLFMVASNYVTSGVDRIVEQLKPKIYPDGDKWCCLYGENIQEGVCGFGYTPATSVDDFVNNFYNQRAINNQTQKP